MVKSIFGIGGRLYRMRPKLTNFSLFILLLQAFLFIAADWVFGDLANTMRPIFIAYFILYLLFRKGGKDPEIKMSDGKWFVVWFFVTTAVMTILLMYGPVASVVQVQSSFEAIKIAAGFGLMHGLVKAYIEEAVFRYFLPVLHGINDIYCSIIFGLFHTGVAFHYAISTGATFPAMTAIMIMAWLSALGFIWAFIRGRTGNYAFGIMGSTGSHYAYNLFPMGIKILG